MGTISILNVVVVVMGRNQAIKSVGQMARFCFPSVSLIILILFNMSPADTKLSLSPLRTDGFVRSPESSLRHSNEITNSVQLRIQGNSLAQDQEFPFHVAILYRGNYKCGGVLIDNYRILTSNDCSKFDLKGMQVSLGDREIFQSDGEKILAVESIEPHPDHNLALLFIDPFALESETIDGGWDSIFPISLPERPQNVRGDLIVTGWGSEFYGGPFSNKLKNATVSVRDCKKPMKGSFCSRQKTSVGPCKGDAGGPVFKSIKGYGFRLVGIIAGTSCKRQCNNPQCDIVYIDISQHLRWINNNQ